MTFTRLPQIPANIANKQDTGDYAAKNQSSGIGVSTGPKAGTTGSVNQGKTDSTYASVTEQAGIYAGDGGFNITVSKNTDLKGAVISSDATPDKNKISTDTLTYSDIQNKAEYSASSVGVNLDTRKDAKLNEKGLTPNIGVKASGDADSTTKSAISPGTIEVRSNPTQDLSKLSRDPEGALNALGKIFDKKTVQEQQELAKVFGEVAFEQIHIISKANGWDEGSPQKIALHAFVGAVMADMGGGNALSGAVGAGLNEAVQKELKDKFKDNPDMHQWASAIIGAAAAAVVGGDAQTGGSTAASGTKNNALYDYEIVRFKDKLSKAVNDGAGKEELVDLIKEYWSSSRGNANGSDSPYHFNDFTDMEGGTVGQDFKNFLKTNVAYDWNVAFAANAYDVNATWANLVDHISSPTTISYARAVNGVTQEAVDKHQFESDWTTAGGFLIGGTGLGKWSSKLAQIGDNFGKAGVLVENPGTKVNWSLQTQHGADRMAERGVTSEMVDSWVQNGKALEQAGGRKHLFFTPDGAAVLGTDGYLVTVIPKRYYDDAYKALSKALFGE